MDSLSAKYAGTLKINHFQPDKVPWRRLGQYLYRIIEDGTTTQQRLGVIESLIPAGATGPVFHFHEMHDEGFLITKGKVRFHSPGHPDIDAKAGDMIVIALRLPHRFSNPFDEEAIFISTLTPAHYVRYFEYLEEMVKEKDTLTPEDNRAAMMRFATVPITPEQVNVYAEARAAADLKRLNAQINGNGVVVEEKKADPLLEKSLGSNSKSNGLKNTNQVESLEK